MCQSSNANMAPTKRKITKIKLRGGSEQDQSTIFSIEYYKQKFGSKPLSPQSEISQSNLESTTNEHQQQNDSQITTENDDKQENIIRKAIEELLVYASARKFKEIKSELIDVSCIIAKMSTRDSLTTELLAEVKDLSLKIQEFKQNYRSSKIRTRNRTRKRKIIRECTESNSSGYSFGSTSGRGYSNTQPVSGLNLFIDVECELGSDYTLVLNIESVPDEGRRLTNLKFVLSPNEKEVFCLMKPRFVVDSVSLSELIKPLMTVRDILKQSPKDRVQVRFCEPPQTDKEWRKKQIALKQFDVTRLFAQGDKWKRFVRDVEDAEDGNWCWDICLIRTVKQNENATETQIIAPKSSIEEPMLLRNLITRKGETKSQIHKVSGYQIDERRLRMNLTFAPVPGYEPIYFIARPTLTSWVKSISIDLKTISLGSFAHDRVIVRFCKLPKSEKDLTSNRDCLPPESCHTANWTKLGKNGPFDITEDFRRKVLVEHVKAYRFNFGIELNKNPLCYGVYLVRGAEYYNQLHGTINEITESEIENSSSFSDHSDSDNLIDSIEDSNEDLPYHVDIVPVTENLIDMINNESRFNELEKANDNVASECLNGSISPDSGNATYDNESFESQSEMINFDFINDNQSANGVISNGENPIPADVQVYIRNNIQTIVRYVANELDEMRSDFGFLNRNLTDQLNIPESKFGFNFPCSVRPIANQTCHFTYQNRHSFCFPYQQIPVNLNRQNICCSFLYRNYPHQQNPFCGDQLNLQYHHYYHHRPRQCSFDFHANQIAPPNSTNQEDSYEDENHFGNMEQSDRDDQFMDQHIGIQNEIQHGQLGPNVHHKTLANSIDDCPVDLSHKGDSQ